MRPRIRRASRARRVICMRRSRLRLGASIGYSTSVPSWCRLTQLFGNTASGQADVAGSSIAWTSTPAACSAAATASNSATAAALAASEGPAPCCWNRLLPAVSGFQPKAAGRIISTARAHCACGEVATCRAAGGCPAGIGRLYGACADCSAQCPAGRATATMRSRPETTVPPGFSTVTTNATGSRTGTAACTGITTSCCDCGTSNTPPSTG